LVGAVSAVCLLGCQTQRTERSVAGDPKIAIRNNSYSLLHQLLDEEKDVSKLRFIKHEDADLKELVNRIAQTSGAGEKLLEQCATNDASLRLDAIELPPGEVATRDAIASTKEKALLEHTGDKFELTLILTQAEAMNYAWHLAKVARENEADPARARLLEGIGKDMENLYDELFSMLLMKTK
jgi:hypothetical protein